MASSTRLCIGSFEHFQPGAKVYFENVQGGIVLDVDSKTHSRLVGWALEPAHGESQYWLIDEPDEGQYTLKNAKTGGYLTAPARNNGTQLTLSNARFRWKVRPGSRRGSFAFESSTHASAMLCNAYGKSHNGNTIWMWSFAPAFHDMMSWYLRVVPGSSEVSTRAREGLLSGGVASSSPPKPRSKAGSLSATASLAASPRHSRVGSKASLPTTADASQQTRADDPADANAVPGTPPTSTPPHPSTNSTTKADTLHDRETTISRREHALEEAKTTLSAQTSEREENLKAAQAQINTAKESLQAQLREKQHVLQQKADELNAREAQLDKRERALDRWEGFTGGGLKPAGSDEGGAGGDAAGANRAGRDGQVEKELETLRMENFDLRQLQEEAQKLRRENQALRSRLEAQSGISEEAKDLVARRDADPFRELKECRWVIDELREEKRGLQERLGRLEDQNGVLRELVEPGRGNGSEDNGAMARSGVGQSALGRFDMETRFRLGRQIPSEFRSMKRL